MLPTPRTLGFQRLSRAWLYAFAPRRPALTSGLKFWTLGCSLCSDVSAQPEEPLLRYLACPLTASVDSLRLPVPISSSLRDMFPTLFDMEERLRATSREWPLSRF